MTRQSAHSIAAAQVEAEMEHAKSVLIRKSTSGAHWRGRVLLAALTELCDALEAHAKGLPLTDALALPIELVKARQTIGDVKRDLGITKGGR